MAKACCNSCTTKALSALCSRWRSLRSAAQRPQTQATRCVRSNVITGFTTATPPIAGCASGYREMCLLSNFPRRNTKAAAHTAAFFAPGHQRPWHRRPINWPKPAATVARPRRYWPCVAAGAACARLRSGRKSRQRGVSDRMRSPVLRRLRRRAQAAPAATGRCACYQTFPRRNTKAAAHTAAFFAPRHQRPWCRRPINWPELAATAAQPRRYRPCVAAGVACARLRSRRNPDNAVYQIERDHRFYDGYAADRRLRQRLQGDAPVIELPP